MFEQFLFFLVLGTFVFLGAVCTLMFFGYRRRQSQRSAPPTFLGGPNNDFLHEHGSQHASPKRLIATIGYAERSKLVTRN